MSISVVIPLTSKDEKTFSTFLNTELFHLTTLERISLILITSYDDMLTIRNSPHFKQNCITFKRGSADSSQRSSDFKIDDRFHCNVTTNWKVVNNLLKFYCWSEIISQYYIVIDGDYHITQQQIDEIVSLIIEDIHPFYPFDREEIITNSDFVNEDGYKNMLANTCMKYKLSTEQIFISDLPSHRIQVLNKNIVQNMLKTYNFKKEYANINFFYIYRMFCKNSN